MGNIFPPRSDEEWLSILNRVYLWAGGFAALFGVIALLATKGIQIYSGRVSAAQRGEIASAVSDTAKAKERTARLEVQIETQRTENLQLQSQVERERIERLHLQQRVLPRRLTESQRSQLKSELERGVAKGMVTVGIFLGTDDGVGFAQDLANVIGTTPGWQIEGRGQFTMGGNISGLAIIVKDLKAIPQRALYLQKAFVDAQITNVPIGDQSQTQIPMSDGEVMLFIAPKP